ncbi:MAG: helix-turn-helix domain-containing protein [Pseudomonadota bacterium]
MSEIKRKRGRPASIDTHSATEAMVELFRAKGYAAVSLDDLSDVTGLSRPSLYRSFGNKLSMYINAMDAFGVQVAKTAVPKLLADGPLEEALSDFFDAMLDIYYRDSEVTPGCLVFGTAPSSSDEARVQARLKFGIDQVDALMRGRFEKASPNGDEHVIETAMHIASNTLIAFSARAKSGSSRNQLSRMGAQSAQAISTLLS